MLAPQTPWKTTWLPVKVVDACRESKDFGLLRILILWFGYADKDGVFRKGRKWVEGWTGFSQKTTRAYQTRAITALQANGYQAHIDHTGHVHGLKDLRGDPEHPYVKMDVDPRALAGLRSVVLATYIWLHRFGTRPHDRAFVSQARAVTFHEKMQPETGVGISLYTVEHCLREIHDGLFVAKQTLIPRSAGTGFRTKRCLNRIVTRDGNEILEAMVINRRVPEEGIFVTRDALQVVETGLLSEESSDGFKPPGSGGVPTDSNLGCLLTATYGVPTDSNPSKLSGAPETRVATDANENLVTLLDKKENRDKAKASLDKPPASPEAPRGRVGLRPPSATPRSARGTLATKSPPRGGVEAGGVSAAAPASGGTKKGRSSVWQQPPPAVKEKGVGLSVASPPPAAEKKEPSLEEAAARARQQSRPTVTLDLSMAAAEVWADAGGDPAGVTPVILVGVYLRSYKEHNGRQLARAWNRQAAVAAADVALRRYGPEECLHVARWVSSTAAGYRRRVIPEMVFGDDWNDAADAADRASASAKRREEAVGFQEAAAKRKQNSLVVTPSYPPPRRGGVWNT